MVQIKHDQQQSSRTKLIVSAAAVSNSNWSVYDTKILLFVGLVSEMKGLKPKDFGRNCVFLHSKRANTSLTREVFETNK